MMYRNRIADIALLAVHGEHALALVVGYGLGNNLGHLVALVFCLGACAL